MKEVDWIAADWGTSNLRVWGLNVEGQVVAEKSSDQGMAKLDRSGFEPALLALTNDWLPQNRQTPVVCCGMVGARQGWIEVPYRQVPCKPVHFDTVGRPETRDPRLRVFILSGIKQTEPTPDVMRGEETQIAGIISEDPQFAGVLCLPGTHTKWVRVHAGNIVRFRTFMTGELFNLLSAHSVLRHSLDGTGLDGIEFAANVEAMAAEAAQLAARLFSIRAQSLVSELSPGNRQSAIVGTVDWRRTCGRQRTIGVIRRLPSSATARRPSSMPKGFGRWVRNRAWSMHAHVTLIGLKSAYLQIAKEFS